MPYKNKLDQKESHRIWHVKNRERILIQQRAYRLRVKRRVFAHYSKEDPPRCECCGELHEEFLSIDHINGGGTRHRGQIGRSYLYFWLIKQNFPEGFRVLCHNCNQASGSLGKCPHQRNKLAGVIQR